MHSLGIPSPKITTKGVELNALGIRINISMPSDLVAQLIDRSGMFLPLGGEKTSRTAEPVEVNVTRGSPSLIIDGKRADFTSNADDGTIVTDTLIIASRLMEKALNELGIFSIAASSVSYDKGAVLLLGPYGSGKTTTAVYLCLKDPMIGYVSGNRIFIDQRSGTVVYGMDSVSMKAGSVIHEFPALGVNLPRGLDLDPRNIDPSRLVQTSKITSSSSKLGLTRADFPLKLKAIALMRKLDSDFVMFEPEKIGDSEILFMYSAICEYSESRYVIIGQRLLFPDIFTQELKMARLDYAEQLIRGTPVVYVEGRLDDMAQGIRKLLIRY